MKKILLERKKSDLHPSNVWLAIMRFLEIMTVCFFGFCFSSKVELLTFMRTFAKFTVFHIHSQYYTVFNLHRLQHLKYICLINKITINNIYLVCQPDVVLQSKICVVMPYNNFFFVIRSRMRPKIRPRPLISASLSRS